MVAGLPHCLSALRAKSSENPLDFPIMGTSTVCTPSMPTGVHSMCGCSTHQAQSGTTAERDPNAVTLKVEE
jgi:hypothetical protein